MKQRKKIYVTTIATSMLAVAGCINNDSSNHPQGNISLAITDAPIDNANHVYVQFSAVEIKGRETHNITFDTPIQLDLLSLQGSSSAAILNDAILPAGNYQWIRLQVDTENQLDSYIELDTAAVHELTIPSNDQSGLKIVKGFTVEENGSVDFTIDFDVRKSVVRNNNGYLLRPTLRLLNNKDVGHIRGRVNETLLSVNCTQPVVYAFAGSVTPTDISGAASDPITTALVSYDETDMVYSYELGFLQPGTYTLGLTCEAGLDDVTLVDNISFISEQVIEVVKNSATQADF